MHNAKDLFIDFRFYSDIAQCINIFSNARLTVEKNHPI